MYITAKSFLGDYYDFAIQTIRFIVVIASTDISARMSSLLVIIPSFILVTVVLMSAISSLFSFAVCSN